MPYGPVYQTALYGEVPPDHEPVMVTDCPLSIGTFEGVIEDIDKGVVADTFTIPNANIIKANVIGDSFLIINLRNAVLQETVIL